jgi:membrane-bound lytic murein transglycosylase MltF
LKKAALLLLAAFLAAGGNVHAQKRGDADRYDPIFRKYSKRFFGVGFDWQYFKAQGMAESDLDPRARSRVGARGVMQLMPATYKEIRSNRQGFGTIDDPEFNIAAGILHDHDLYDRWQREHSSSPEESARFMFGAYNAGEGPILRAKKIARNEKLDEYMWQSMEQVAPKVERWRYQETLPYVAKIEKTHEELQKQPRRSNAAKKK